MKQSLSLTQGRDRYLTYLEHDRRVTPNSLRNYKSTISRFIATHRVLDEDTVKRFLRTYNDPASANAALTRLRGFAESLDISLVRVPRAKEAVKEVEALTSAEVTPLVEACRSFDALFADATEFLYHTGLRFHELYGLKASSLHNRSGVAFLKVVGKGRKFREVPLNQSALVLFERNEFAKLKAANMQKRFRSCLALAGEAANLPFRCHPHLLRATFASVHLNERGTNPLILCKIGGWSNPKTLSDHYFRPSLQVLQQAV